MNLSDKSQQLYGIYAGYAAFFILLILSILFFRERTCFSDSAFQGFHIVNTGKVSVPLDRFGSVLVQTLPALLVNLHVPLKYVLMAYSASFVIQNLILFMLLHLVLRQYQIALILALYNVLMVTETFYLPTSEVKQGFSLAIFFSGMLVSLPLVKFRGLNKAAIVLLYVSVLFTAIFLHPLVITAVLFIIGYVAICHQGDLKATIRWSFLIATVAVALKFIVLRTNEYDALMYGRSGNFIKYFPDYFSLPSFFYFLEYCLTDWYLFALIVAAILIFYLRKKFLLKLFWVLAFTTSYLLLINVAFPIGENKSYIEAFYLALGIFVLYPFVTELLPQTGKYAIVMLLMVFGLRLHTIYKGHSLFTARLEWMHDMLAHSPRKFIIRENDAPMDFLKLPWAVAFESLMLSSIVSPDSSHSFIILRDAQYFGDLDSVSNYIYTPMRAVNYEKLNPHYFRPKPSYYRVLSKNEVLNAEPYLR